MADEEDIGIVVASTAVLIVPDTTKFGALLKSELNPQADVIGKQIGQQLSETIARSIQQGLKDGLSDAPIGPATDTGSRTGGAFASAFKDRVTAALRDLPEPNVGLDATELDAQLADIRARLKALGDAKIGVDIDEGAALAEIETLHAALVQLRLDSPTVQVKVDTGRALLELEAVKKLADSINSAPIADAERSLTVLPQLGEDAAKTFGEATSSVSSMTIALAAVAPAIIPVGAALIGAFAGGVTLLGAFAGGLGVVALGAKGVADEVSGEVTPAIHELQASAADGLLPGVEAGVHSLLTLLPQLDGFVNGLAHDLGDLATEGSTALTSPYWQQFYKFIQSEAGPVLTVFGTILGNLAHGAVGLLEAFKPVTDELGTGIEHLSEKFAAFGENAGSSSSFQSFLRYIEAEGPQVVKDLGDFADVAERIVQNLAPFGSEVLHIADDFAELDSKLSTGLLGKLTSFAQKISSLPQEAIEKGLVFAEDITGIGGGSTPTAPTSPTDLTGFSQNITGVEGQLADIDTAELADTADLAGFYKALDQGGILSAFDDNIETVKVHILDTADVLKQASSEVNAAISGAVTPAVTGITDAVRALSAAQSAAGHSDFEAIISHQAMVDADAYAKAWQDVATKTGTAAQKAKELADALPADTAAAQQAKVQAEALATALAAKAAADDKAAKSAQDSADKQTKAYQQIAAAAETATQDATAAARQLVANIGDSTNALLSEVSGFRQQISGGISQGTDLGSIWQSLIGTDAAGNPIDPTITQVQTSLDKTLAQVVSFSADLSTIRKEGGPDSEGLIEEITGLGDVNGDALAKELIAAGTSTIQAFEQTTDSIDKLADSEAAHLAKSFYGAGVTSMQNLISGIDAQFPALRSALAPLIEALETAFTITPVINLPTLPTATKTAKGKGDGNSVPGFADGVLDFVGGKAWVGENGPELVTLPQGADVIPNYALQYSGGAAASTVSHAVAQHLAGAAAAASGLGDVTVYAQFGDETITAKTVRVANGVVDQRVTAGQERAGRGVPGTSLDHLTGV